jgi:hypothetical protein
LILTLLIVISAKVCPGLAVCRRQHRSRWLLVAFDK